MTGKLWIGGLAIVFVSVAGAAADWLVMRDGGRIETDGPWSERGKLVVFTDSGGNLVSLRLSDVDLEASRQATADAIEAANRPAPPPPPPPESVFRLTDADVGHLDPTDEEGEDGEEEATGGEATSAATNVVVIGWDSDDTGEDGLQIRGTIENQGEDVAVGLTVAVTIYADDGIALSTTNARLTTTGLIPGQTTEMIADFPGVFDFTAVNFDIEHRSLASRPSEEIPRAADSFPTEG